MNDDNDNPDREHPTDPDLRVIADPPPVETSATEPAPAPEPAEPAPLPHESDPHFEYKTHEWPEGDYKGEPHPWQTTKYIK